MNTSKEWRIKLLEEGFNPFINVNVGDPWDEIHDVEGIHQHVDKSISSIFKHIVNDPVHQSQSVLLHGFAGSGKSHLLSRIRKKYNDQVYFTYVQPMVSDCDHWKYLQRQVIGSLLRPYPLNRKYTQLHYLICRGVQITLPEEFEFIPDKSFFTHLEENPINLQYYLCNYDGLDQQIIHTLAKKFRGQINNKEFFRILIQFLNPTFEEVAENWLRCNGLDEDECIGIGISKEYAKDEFNESMARDFLTGLFFWSSYDRPIILCFDQLDHYTVSGNSQKIINYADIIAHIVNYTKNVLCFSSILTDSIDDFNKIITDPATQSRLQINADAPVKQKLPLQPITDKNSILQIIETRLAQLHKKLDITDPLFPFTPDSAQEILQTLYQNGIEKYPRAIIRECEKEYDRRLQDELVPVIAKPVESMEEFLQKTYAGRRDFYIKENYWVPDENMEEEQLRRILQCVVDHGDGKRIVQIRDFRGKRNQHKPWDFEFDTLPGKTYAVEVYENHSNAWYARHLQKMLNAWNYPEIQSVFWIRRKNNKITLGTVGNERMQIFIQRGGFALTDWSEKEWNSIQALIWMLNESSGGNLLYYDGKKDVAINPKQIEKWIAASRLLHELPVINTLLNQVSSHAPIDTVVITETKESKENYLETAGYALGAIVKKQYLIELDKAYQILLQQEHFAGLTKDDCLRSVDYAEGVICHTAQNHQILYLGS